jgi:hypothetical protein
MHWLGWTLLTVWVLSAIAGVLAIGEPREPKTPLEAACGIVVVVLFIAALFHSPLVYR